MPLRMIRVLFVLSLTGLALPLLAQAPAAPAPAPATPTKAEREAAAAVQPPSLPSLPPLPASVPPPTPPEMKTGGLRPTNPPGSLGPVAPPLPGQLKALPPPAPRPALSPPSRIPNLPKPALTPVPGVPLNKGGSKTISSTSSTGQFIVHGDDLKLRSAFSGRCEEVASGLRQLLKDKEPWQLPIVLLLKTGDAARAPGPAASTTISQISHGGFHLQVNVNVRGDLRPSDLRAELIRVLLAERILRQQKELATNRERLLPDWVFTGVLEALDYRQRARPSALFAAIFKSGKIYGIEEIIEASAASIEDGLSKTIYQTSCCALVLALLDHPDGGLRLSKFLNALASDKRPERELLNQWFPGFAATPASLNKWWSLQLANLASPTVSEPLTPAETIKRLEDALTLRYKASPGEIPKPRPVMAAAKPTGTEPSVKPASKPATESDPTTTAEVDETSDEKKPSFLSRLNPFGKRSRSDEVVIEEAMAEAALAEAKISSKDQPPAAAETTPAADTPPDATSPQGPVFVDRKPLFDRFFGSDNKSADTPTPEPTPEAAATPAPKKVEPAKETAAITPSTGKPAVEKKTPEKKTPESPGAETPETEEAPKKEPGKPSVLNPLNWFRGGKKPKPDAEPETPEEAPTKKAPATAWTPSSRDLLWAWSPLLSDVYSGVMPPSSRPAAPRQVEGFLGLKFGKKKGKAEGETETPPATPKTEEAKPKETKKSTPPPAPAAAPKPDDAPKPAKEEPAPGDTGFLGLKFGKKKGKTEAATETPTEAPKTEEAKPKETKKPESSPAPKPDEAPKPAQEEPAPVETAEEKLKPAPAAPIKITPLFGKGKKETPAPDSAPVAETPAAPAPSPAEPNSEPRSKAKAKADGGTLVDAVVPIEDYAAIMKRKDRADILKRNINALAGLQTRAAVLFRPIIVEYSEVLAGLLEGNAKGADERLRSLRTRTEKALAQSKAIRDFLDVYEANESPVFSGLFDDYLKLPQTIEKELPARTDPLSNYLDALDREFSGR